MQNTLVKILLFYFILFFFFLGGGGGGGGIDLDLQNLKTSNL